MRIIVEIPLSCADIFMIGESLNQANIDTTINQLRYEQMSSKMACPKNIELFIDV